MSRTKPSYQPGDERTALYERLDWQRQTVRMKAEGLSEADAHRRLLPSPLTTVAGLVAHLRWVEFSWFDTCMLGATDTSSPWTTSEHPDAEMLVDDVPLGQLLDEYDVQCAHSRRIADRFALDDLEHPPEGGGSRASLRWILLHMIEETARHNGHLDVLRELIDGTTGE